MYLITIAKYSLELSNIIVLVTPYQRTCLRFWEWTIFKHGTKDSRKWFHNSKFNSRCNTTCSKYSLSNISFIYVYQRSSRDPIYDIYELGSSRYDRGFQQGIFKFWIVQVSLTVRNTYFPQKIHVTFRDFVMVYFTQ